MDAARPVTTGSAVIAVLVANLVTSFHNRLTTALLARIGCVRERCEESEVN
jgi:hypothetical protein